MNIKEEIKAEMNKVALRKPGKCKLVFRKETKTIWEMNNEGEYLRDTGMSINET